MPDNVVEVVIPWGHVSTGKICRGGGEGAEGLARTGWRKRASLSFDKSDACCTGLDDIPRLSLIIRSAKGGLDT